MATATDRSTAMWTESSNGTTGVAETEILPNSVKYLFATLHFALFVFILFGNIMTILAIIRTPELRIAANLYVTQLAVADSLVGVGAGVMALLYLDSSRRVFDTSKYLCMGGIIVLICTSAAQSLMTLTLMATDRLVQVAFPFRHVQYFTEKSIKRRLLCSWILALAIGTVPIYYSNFSARIGCVPFKVLRGTFNAIYIPVSVLITIVVTKACYAAIACIARKHRMALLIRGVRMTAPDGLQPRQEDNNTDELRRHRSGSSSVNHKSLMLFITVNTLFSVCWSPFVVTGLLSDSTDVPEMVSSLILLLVLSNSGMNFFVFACRNKQFARAYRDLMATCFRRQAF